VYTFLAQRLGKIVQNLQQTFKNLIERLKLEVDKHKKANMEEMLLMKLQVYDLSVSGQFCAIFRVCRFPALFAIRVRQTRACFNRFCRVYARQIRIDRSNNTTTHQVDWQTQILAACHVPQYHEIGSKCACDLWR